MRPKSFGMPYSELKRVALFMKEDLLKGQTVDEN